MTDSSEIAYRRGELSPEQVRDEIARFWADVKPGSEAQAQIDAVGLGSVGLSQVDEVDAITVRVGSSGADPASVVLIIAFAPTANRALKDLWATVLLPRIRRRWGDDAVGGEVTRHDR